jgi:malate dehydrogenase
MERADLLTANGAIFTVQGKAIAENAKEDVKVLVVGNPCNTNAYIAAPPPRKSAAPTRTTTTACCASTTTAPCRNWPPRPAARFLRSRSWSSGATTRRRCTPTTATASNGDNVKALINDHAWNNDVFLPTVGKRGAAIIEARGLSSAASAANAAIDHIRDWVLGSDDWVTMGVPSDGSYGIPAGIVSASRASARAVPSRSSRAWKSTSTQPREDQFHAQGTDRRSRSRQGHAVIQH